MQKIIIICCLAVLTACLNDNIEYKYPQDPSITRKSRAGRFFDDITLYGGKNKKGRESYKSKNILWVASFDVVSSLFPIAIADSNSGIVVSDWYQNADDKDLRVKINILVKGKDIKEDNLAISVFKQKRDSKGQWQDIQLDNSNLLAKLISKQIIDKANNTKSHL